MPGRPNGTFTEPDWFGIYLVFLLSIIFTIIYFESKKTRISNFQFPISNEFPIFKFLISNKINYVILTIVFVTLILTVSRSAWLGAAFVVIGFLKIILTNGQIKISKWNWRGFHYHISVIALVVGVSLLISTQLTNFQIFKRAQSTGGLQKITVSCERRTSLNTESVIGNVSELSQYGCKFINLEEIEKEKSQGFNVFEIKRPDPTVGIRAQIYAKSIEQIKNNAIFGIGWGSISDILGKDENGIGLNASNIFLETWLGSGVIGFLSLFVLFSYILIKSLVQYLSRHFEDKTPAVFASLGLFALVIPNLFNSGIFLGFLWIYIGVAISLVGESIISKK
ncbi:MAG: hypothetical protein ACD_5C00331G0001 [uncultured bacterium]|nr:MAG: hypothetical protein ACD_5C00331G0001 [uncultured bacterium]